MSPLIKPDLSQAQEFTNIEPGTYPAEIKTCTFEQSKNNNPMIVPNFEVQVADKVFKRKAYLVINGEGAYGFGQLLRACHFDDLATAYADKSIPLADKPDFNTDDLQGQKLMVVIDHQMYNGQPRDYIKNYLRA
jgi:hypothetical protein